MHSYTWTHQCWPTSKDWRTSALRGLWMQSRRPTRGYRLEGLMVREIQRTRCCQRDMMVFMIHLYKVNEKHVLHDIINAQKVPHQCCKMESGQLSILVRRLKIWFPCKMALLRILLVLFVNDWMPTSQGDGRAVGWLGFMAYQSL